MSVSLPWAGGRRPGWAGELARGRWPLVAALWSLAVLASAAQIYLREAHRGTPAAWPAVLLANLLAWLPWLLAVAPALRLERRVPIIGPGWRRGVALHLALAVGFAAAFLLYLSVFHLLYLERSALSPAVLRAEYAEQLGRFFLTATTLYLAIVVAGFAERSWREARAGSRPRATGGPPAAAPAEALVVRSTGRLERIDPAEIRWIGAEGNYARLRLPGRSLLHRSSLAALAEELADRRFARIHRSVIVNLRHARSLERRSHGDAILVLDDGSRLKVSRTYRKAVAALDF